MSEVSDNIHNSHPHLEVLGILSHYRNQDGSYSIQAVAGRSGLHVRPSIALFRVISKYIGKFDTFINNQHIESGLDIISLGLTGNISFEIKLKGDSLQEIDALNFIQEVKDIEKPEVAGCESIPHALQRILGK